MGFFSDVGNKIRKSLVGDKERIPLELAKGVTASSYPSSGFDLLQAYGYDIIHDYLRLENDLLSRFVDYEEMDDYGELASALDIYADDATQIDSTNRETVWITCDDKDVQEDLNWLFHKKLRIDEEVWEIARSLVKYGNDYEEILVNNEGVIGLNFLPAPTCRRVEGSRGELFGFLQDFRGRFGFSPQDFQQLLAARSSAISSSRDPKDVLGAFEKTAALEDWEVVHFRLRSKQRRSLYGFSVMEPARWIYKRLILLEVAALIYRLQRAPERFAFYVNVGDMPQTEALAYVNRVRQMHKKRKYYDPSTGKLSLKWEPLPVAHDTPIPLLDGRTIPIRQMAEEFAAGKKNWTYSIDRDTGHIVPGEVSWVGKTRENAPAVRVTFDDGNSMVVAPDHPVMRRDRSYVNAVDLRPGDSVMPFYRKVSDKSKGDGLNGYELVYDPEEQVYLYTHRVVSGNLGLHQAGQVIHHQNFDRRNNDPSNLLGMVPKDHVEMHAALGHLGGEAVARKRLEDPVLDAKLRAASSRNLTEYNRSAEKRLRTSEQNRLRDQASIVRRYNDSPQHALGNSARRAAREVFWADIDRVESFKEKCRLVFPPEFLLGVKALVRDNPEISAEGVVQAVNESVLLTGLRESNGRTRNLVRSVHRHLLLKMYRSEGFESFSEFKSAVLCDVNHKVVSVVPAEPCDHFCMTVERWHNFALNLRDGEGRTVLKSGVFVKNSQDDDFWIPSRKGEDSTRVEVLGSPNWQHMDDIEYFRDKLFAAIKVPKAYLGQEEGVARAVLSSEDVRFARTVLRIQREVRNGLHKIGRVHLAARGIRPDSVDFDVMMTVPSAIFELAQLEVRNARADLAGRMKDFVSMHWILSKIFGLSDEEIKDLTKQRSEDALQDSTARATAEAEGQKIMQSVMPSPEGGFESRRPIPVSKSISEKDLFAGSREAEKRLEGKVDSIMRENTRLGRRMRELHSLLEEIRTFSHRRAA
jgi:intein/homing endonuclease